MATTGLAQDQRFQQHVTGDGHPERPERLVRIAETLEGAGLAGACAEVRVSPIEHSLVQAIHDDGYLERLDQACRDGLPYIDVPDSAICPDSQDIAALAAGAVINAVDDVMAGRIQNAFCAVRPPGHHAERRMSLGFCLFNNVAIAAAHLLNGHGLKRVVVLDWDVHHGNGTQHTFEYDGRVLFVSIHGHPAYVYPGTGHAHERGHGDGEGMTLNVPMQPHSDDAAYRKAFDDTILPAIDAYKPQFVLVSAGFDAHRADPLAPLDLETESFGWMTDTITSLARTHCEGRLVSVLEGGYDLKALGDSVALHVKRLLEA